MSRNRPQLVLLAGLLGLSLARNCARLTVITTSVRDSAGAAIVPCRIEVMNTKILAFGDSIGRVLLPAVPYGPQMLRVQGVGYFSRIVPLYVQGDSLWLPAVVLRRNPLLDSVQVVAPSRPRS